MTPMFALPAVLPVFSSQTLPFSGPAAPSQAVDFGALISGLPAPAAVSPATPEIIAEPANAPSPVPENDVAAVTTSEATIAAEILPLIDAFSGNGVVRCPLALPSAHLSAETRTSYSQDIQAEPAEPGCSELALQTPVAVPIIANLPTAATVIVAAPVLPSAPTTARADQAPTTPTRNQPTSSSTLPPAQKRPLLSNHAPVIPIADLAALSVSAPVEQTAPSTIGFQAMVTGELVDTAVRPSTDASMAIAERALDVARGSLWLDQLASDIVAAQDSERDLAFRLIPAQLGQLDVKIASRDDGMQLNFSTQTEEAARIIASAQSRLVEDLKAQGVRVMGSEVNTWSGQSSFAQQHGQSRRSETIAEFERASPVPSEPTPQNEPQNGRFA